MNKIIGMVLVLGMAITGIPLDTFANNADQIIELKPGSSISIAPWVQTIVSCASQATTYYCKCEQKNGMYSLYRVTLLASGPFTDLIDGWWTSSAQCRSIMANHSACPRL